MFIPTSATGGKTLAQTGTDAKVHNFTKTWLENLLIKNHTAANKGKLIGDVPLEYLFSCCETFKKVTKGLRIQIEFTMSDLKHLIYRTIETDTKVNLNSSYLCVATFIPDAQNQYIMKVLKKSFDLEFDDWLTMREATKTVLNFKLMLVQHKK